MRKKKLNSDFSNDNVEQLTISKAVSVMSLNNSKMLQIHVFGDKKKTKACFAAFFILGEDGEPAEAIEKMKLLKEKWDEESAINKIELKGEMEISYLMQQIDTNGAHDITRPCKSVLEFIKSLKQYGINKLGKGQRLVKRFDIPLYIDSIRGGDYENTI